MHPTTGIAEWARTDPEEVAIEAAMRARRVRNGNREDVENREDEA